MSGGKPAPEATTLVVSYPKSGRTWLRVMLEDAGIASDYDHQSSHYQKPRHHAQMAINIDPRYRRVIALFRDPRDATVSGFHHCSFRLAIFAGSMAEFVRDEWRGIEKAARFNLMLAELVAARDDVLPVSYEGLHADTKGALLRIAAFGGGRLSEKSAAAIVARQSFEQMRSRERSGAYGRDRAFSRIPGENAAKVRRGVIGSFRDEWSADDIAFADAVLERLNYFERMKKVLGSS